MSAALRESMWVAVQLAAPLLGGILLVGLVVALFQAMTQVQEASLAFLPKLAVCGGALLVLGPFMVDALQNYAATLFDQMVALGGAH
nr:flagellar biosynthetic protein FliQ [Roseomonas mucosa]